VSQNFPNIQTNFRVVDFVAEVTVEQDYVNREANPIETVYMFPIEEEAAVIDFCAEVDGRKIKTQVRKKEEARQVFQHKKSVQLLLLMTYLQHP
jgi:Ca-activated chloride channel family protein